MTVPPLLPALVKPTLDTPFHIDYDWWERKQLHIGVELQSHLCQEHRAVFDKEHFDLEKIDWVDEKTGQVKQVIGLQHVLQVHCSKQPDYIHEGLSLVDTVFRIFLANGNTPLTCRELSSIVGGLPKRILRTLSGTSVYKGIRPAPQD
ncbi:MAG: hypothetical protein DRJ03_09010 [Chloroflexi bacterium]|nr:MAG: hypothetical protein B6I35_02645 [Anaerolineaceae bacterium 4572_32.2]RLC81620.1 MAG: hypothetical protein DRI81_01940 [Chloroflexota bacterium]RLC86360.1 MAG: hypothetical protein DRJ03_09010 [Chloroflexota bacterium]HEY73260.1 hypothetical protein [Thermoflexia bacterium]